MENSAAKVAALKLFAFLKNGNGKFRVKKMKILRRITRKEAEELLKIEKGAHK